MDPEENGPKLITSNHAVVANTVKEMERILQASEETIAPACKVPEFIAPEYEKPLDLNKELKNIATATGQLREVFRTFYRNVERVFGESVRVAADEVLIRQAISKRRFDELPVKPVKSEKPSSLIVNLVKRTRQ